MVGLPSGGVCHGDAHFRFETLDIDVVVAVFEAYARNDPSYQTAYPWQPCPL